MNFTICDGNATEFKASMSYFGQQWGAISNVTNMSNALDAVADMMASTYPLTFSCYYGFSEA